MKKFCVIAAGFAALAISSGGLALADETTCTQGQRSSRIVEHGRGKLAQWPGFGVLRLNNQAGKKEIFICGSTAILPEYVLTAAHCIIEMGIEKSSTGDYRDESGRLLQVVLGVDDLDTIPAQNVFDVSEVHVHESYNGAEKGDDIALLKLTRPWPGSCSVLGKLRVEDEAVISPAIRVAGFGAGYSLAPVQRFVRADGSEYQAYTQIMKQSTLVGVPVARCERAYPDKAISISKNQLCAGQEWPGEDSCQGDSGGPAVVIDPSSGCPRQVGLVSWGEGCGVAGKYGVYTRISEYENWIQSKIKQAPASGISDEVSLGEQQRKLLSQLNTTMQVAQASLSIDLGKQDFKVGDLYRIKLDLLARGRLILLETRSNGEIIQIYPNKFTEFKGHTLGPGPAMFPDSSYGFDAFEADKPTGKVELLAILVPEVFPYDSLVAKEDLIVKDAEGIGRIVISDRDRSYYLVNLIDQIQKALELTHGGSGWGYSRLEYNIHD